MKAAFEQVFLDILGTFKISNSSTLGTGGFSVIDRSVHIYY